ncbi:MAG TPA: helix-turn-helix domain-containing protein [Ktedonobacterales bacterium]|nr:helix-turn-helix domain-containing protein [Ktedonobacterales bacterium]
MTIRDKTAKRPRTGKAPPGQRPVIHAVDTNGSQERADQSQLEAGAPAQERRPDERQQREERILDAATSLLVRWGYRKTTIDDVAREAGVGKGTIYLHWRDKNELFRAAVWRAERLLSEDIMRRVAADPEGGLLHRLWMHGMLAALDNPLMAAIMTGQPDILQGLIRGLDQQERDRLVGNGEEYVVHLQRVGLIRADIPASVITFLMTALKIGIINPPDLIGQERRPSIEQLGEAVSDLLRRWLEPERAPSESEAGKRLLAEMLENVQSITGPRESKGKRK